jgi:hypothetical protein
MKHSLEGDMDTKAVQEGGLQLVGGTHFRSGKRAIRIKPKHMRRTTVNIAALTFAQMQSADDAAKSIGGPGITGKTVIECVGLNLLRRVEALESIMNSARGLAA